MDRYKRADNATLRMKNACDDFEKLFKEICNIQKDLNSVRLNTYFDLAILNLMQTRIGLKMVTDKCAELLASEKERLTATNCTAKKQ